ARGAAPVSVRAPGATRRGPSATRYDRGGSSGFAPRASSGRARRGRTLQRCDAANRTKARGVSGGLQGQAVDLALHELAVQTLLAHQTVGGAVLNRLAELQHDDAVEIPDRG